MIQAGQAFLTGLTQVSTAPSTPGAAVPCMGMSMSHLWAEPARVTCLEALQPQAWGRSGRSHAALPSVQCLLSPHCPVPPERPQSHPQLPSVPHADDFNAHLTPDQPLIVCWCRHQTNPRASRGKDTWESQCTQSASVSQCTPSHLWAEVTEGWRAMREERHWRRVQFVNQEVSLTMWLSGVSRHVGTFGDTVICLPMWQPSAGDWSSCPLRLARGLQATVHRRAPSQMSHARPVA